MMICPLPEAFDLDPVSVILNSLPIDSILARLSAQKKVDNSTFKAYISRASKYLTV